jgi:ankyrin repeat protein
VKSRSEGYSALHEAAEEGHEAVVRLLLEKGAEIDAKCLQGKTAEQLAADKGHQAVLKLLTPS